MQLLGVVTLLLLSACGRIDPPEKYGALVVAVRDAPALFQPPEKDGGEISGFNYDTVEAFATTLGVKTSYVKAANPDAMLQLLRDGKVHFAASLPVNVDAAQTDELKFSPALRKSQPVLVRHADTLKPDGLDDLAGLTVEVVPGTPQAASLRMLAEASRPLISERKDSDDIALLARVANRASELAASDSTSVDIATNFYPDLTVAAELPGEIKFVWAFPANTDPTLFARAETFIEHIRKDGTLARISDRYFGHIHRVNPQGIVKLLELRQTILPHYRRDFVAAQEISGIDWRLLAALAYQESKWDPLATSPTGVRGMMMLTEDTADRMKVNNRLDAAQSIRAGARYLAGIIDDLPPSVVGQDRTWLGLAGYNLGMGHLNGARQFAVGLKRDPNSWYDMKQVLPLLARPEYYQRLKSGRARGGEAVIMVENVRSYFDVLSRFEPAMKYASPLPFTR
jgi:membrane-bound lytic murein transglycosylase F